MPRNYLGVACAGVTAQRVIWTTDCEDSWPLSLVYWSPTAWSLPKLPAASERQPAESLAALATTAAAQSRPLELGRIVLNAKRPARFGSEPKRTEYRCVDCDRTVAYPETVFCDGRCGDCVSGETEDGA